MGHSSDPLQDFAKFMPRGHSSDHPRDFELFSLSPWVTLQIDFVKFTPAGRTPPGVTLQIDFIEFTCEGGRKHSSGQVKEAKGTRRSGSPTTSGYIGRRGFSLSGSYQQEYSAAYNTQSHIKVVCNGYILTHISN